jgi:hypothetical protein
MKTITQALFTERLAELASGLEECFPMIRIDRRDPTELWLKTEHCTGLVDLRSTDDAFIKRVNTSVASGTALRGTCEYVREGLNNYHVVMSALGVARLRFEDTLVSKD